MGGVSFPGRVNARLGSGRTERYTAFARFHTLRAYLSRYTPIRCATKGDRRFAPALAPLFTLDLIPHFRFER